MNTLKPEPSSGKSEKERQKEKPAASNTTTFGSPKVCGLVTASRSHFVGRNSPRPSAKGPTESASSTPRRVGHENPEQVCVAFPQKRHFLRTYFSSRARFFQTRQRLLDRGPKKEVTTTAPKRPGRPNRPQVNPPSAVKSVPRRTTRVHPAEGEEEAALDVPRRNGRLSLRLLRRGWAEHVEAGHGSRSPTRHGCAGSQ